MEVGEKNTWEKCRYIIFYNLQTFSRRGFLTLHANTIFLKLQLLHYIMILFLLRVYECGEEIGQKRRTFLGNENAVIDDSSKLITTLLNCKISSSFG